MNLRQRASDILRSAERDLVKLAAEAGESRAYADASALLDAARQVKGLGDEVLAADTQISTAIRDTATLQPTVSAPANVDVSTRPAKGRRPRKADYPQFFREGDTLIKVGWSKSEGSEYEHKCPKRVLDVLMHELTRITGPGKRFVMDKVLPLRDPDTGTEFSSYQPYLALAFLRQSRLVEQHGRSGYSIPKPKSLIADAGAAWTGIESR